MDGPACPPARDLSLPSPCAGRVQSARPRAPMQVGADVRSGPRPIPPPRRSRYAPRPPSSSRTMVRSASRCASPPLCVVAHGCALWALVMAYPAIPVRGVEKGGALATGGARAAFAHYRYRGVRSSVRAGRQLQRRGGVASAGRGWPPALCASDAKPFQRPRQQGAQPADHERQQCRRQRPGGSIRLSKTDRAEH
jgi:hypothetical protein